MAAANFLTYAGSSPRTACSWLVVANTPDTSASRTIRLSASSSVQLGKCLGWPRPSELFRMQQVREQFDAFDQARAGAREIGIGIERMDPVVHHGRKRIPAGLRHQPSGLRQGARYPESAG